MISWHLNLWCRRKILNFCNWFFFLSQNRIHQRKSINTQKSITKEPPTSSRKSIKTQNRKRKITNALFAQQQRKTTSIENKKKEKKMQGNLTSKELGNWLHSSSRTQSPSPSSTLKLSSRDCNHTPNKHVKIKSEGKKKTKRSTRRVEDRVLNYCR